MASDTRDQILATANRLFTEQGYDGTSLREIADDLDITKAALYYHFRSKEDILAALIQPFIDSVDGLVTRLENADDLSDWADAIEWIIAEVLEHTPQFTLLQRNRAVIGSLAHSASLFSDHQQMHERVDKAVAHAGRDVPERVRMVAALGAVTGFDDWAPTLLMETDAAVLRDELRGTVHDILGLPAD